MSALAIMGVSALMAAGCGSDEPSSPVVGQTLDSVRTALPDATLVIYDLSHPVLGTAASYNDGLPQDQWVVITSCGSATAAVVPVGVIPSTGYGEDVEAEAQDGDFDELLAECS